MRIVLHSKVIECLPDGNDNEGCFPRGGQPPVATGRHIGTMPMATVMMVRAKMPNDIINP